MAFWIGLFLLVAAVNGILLRRWPALRPARRMERLARLADRWPRAVPFLFALVYGAFLYGLASFLWERLGR